MQRVGSFGGNRQSSRFSWSSKRQSTFSAGSFYGPIEKFEENYTEGTSDYDSTSVSSGPQSPDRTSIFSMLSLQRRKGTMRRSKDFIHYFQVFLKNKHSFSFSRKQGRGSRLLGPIQEAQFVGCQFNKKYLLWESINPDTTAVLFEDSIFGTDIFSTGKFNQLSKLDKFSFINNEFSQSLKDILNSLPNSIKELSFSGKNQFKNESSANSHNADAFFKFTELAELQIPDLNISNGEDLLSHLNKLPLKVVNLSGNPIPNLLEHIKSKELLLSWKRLIIANIDLTDALVEKSIEAFDYLPELEYLDVSGNQISFVFLRAIINNLALFPRLKVIAASDTLSSWQEYVEVIKNSNAEFKLHLSPVIESLDQLNFLTGAIIDKTTKKMMQNLTLFNLHLKELTFCLQGIKNVRKLKELANSFPNLSVIRIIGAKRKQVNSLLSGSFPISNLEKLEIDVKLPNYSSPLKRIKQSFLEWVVSNRSIVEYLNSKIEKKETFLLEELKLTIQTKHSFALLIKILNQMPNLKRLELVFGEIPHISEYTSEWCEIQSKISYIKLDFSNSTNISDCYDIVSLFKQICPFRYEMTLVFTFKQLLKNYSFINSFKDYRCQFKRVGDPPEHSEDSSTLTNSE